ncbi:unnamed protein product, partial [Prunus brigantina]
MSDLIRRCRSVTTTPSSEPPPQPASAATAPTQMDQLAVGPMGSQTPASSASSVAQPVSAKRRHRPVSTTDTTSTDASGSQPTKRNTRGPCRQLKTVKVTRVTNSRINIRYDERHRAAPTPELHSSLAHDTNYNLEDLDDESSAYLNRLFSDRIKPKLIRAIGRRRLFSTIQVPGPSPIGWMHGGGSKFPEIDVFGDVYVRPRNELAESLHVNDDGGEEPIGSSGVCLSASSRDSDRVCGSSTGCWVSDPDGDVGSDSREEAGDILSRDGECPAEGTQTPSSSAVKSGNCFDCTGGHTSESDVGDSGVPRTVRHSNPAVSYIDLRARPPRASAADHGPCPDL